MARRVELGCMKKFEGTDTREAFTDTSGSDVSTEPPEEDPKIQISLLWSRVKTLELKVSRIERGQ